MSGPWEQFAAPAGAPAGATPPPWEQFSTPDPDVTPTGAGAIPRGPRPAAPAPETDMQARVARMKAQPPGVGDKIMGAVEAGLNLVTSITNFPIGVGSGLLRNATTMVGQGAGAVATAIDRKSRGLPASMPGGPHIGDDLENPLSGQDMQAVTYQPKTDQGQDYVEDVVQPAMNAAGPLIGHGHEVAHAAPAVAPVARAAGDAVRPVARAAGDVAVKGAAKMIGVDPELAKVAQLAGDLKHPIDVRPDQVVRNAKYTKLAGQAAGDVPLSGSKTKSNQVAFTKNAIDLINPEETGDRLTPETFSKAMDRSGSGIGEIMARTDVPLDAELRSGLDSLRENVDAKQSADTAKIVNSYIDELHAKAGDDGVIDGTALRAVNSEIGAQARTNAGNDLGAKLNDLQGLIEDATQKNVHPDDAQPLKDFRRQYAYGKILEPTVAKTIDGVLPPSQLMGQVTSTKLGKHLMANAKGGPIGDLAKVGQLIKEPGTSFTAERGAVLAGLSGAGYVEPHTAAAAYAGANIYNRGGPRLVRAMVGKKARPEPPAAAEPPPEPTTSPGAGGGGGGGGEPPAPGPLGDLTPDWSTSPGAGGGAPRGGHEPGLVSDSLDRTPTRMVDERLVKKGAGQDIPAVPGRPGLPDTVVSGGPAETAATDRANAAMTEPGAIEARRQQAPKPPEMPEPSPVLTETQRLAAEHQSPAVRRAIQEHEASVKAKDAAAAAAVAREHDAIALEKAARDTTDSALQARLLKQADKLRGTEPIPVGKMIEGEPPAEPIPVGKVVEGQPEIKVDKPGKVPVGEATEITPEYVEADRAWRAEHKLGAEDAQRARDVAAALQHDEVGVHRAVRQFENQPRAFDREIARITEEGEARANESKQPAGGSPGDATVAEGTRPPVRSGEGGSPVRAGAEGDGSVSAAGAEAARHTEPEPAAAVRAADEQPGADGVREAGADGAGQEAAGGRADAGAQGKPGVNHRPGDFVAIKFPGDKADPAGYTKTGVLISEKDGQFRVKPNGGKEITVGAERIEVNTGPAVGKGKIADANRAHAARVLSDAAVADAKSAKGLTVREVDGGFEAYRDGKKVGYLRDNLERGQAEQLGENANVDMVKVDKEEQGKGVGRALYEAFNEKHGGRIMPSGKTEPSAWALWKRNYPDKVDAFVKQEAARIRDGGDAKLVAGNITDPEVRSRVLQAAEAGEAGEAKVVRTTNDPLDGRVHFVKIGDDPREFAVNRGDAGMGSPTWMLDTADHWKQGPAQSQNGYVSTYLGDTKTEALQNLPDVVKRLDASPGYAKEAPKGPELQTEAEFGAPRQRAYVADLTQELADAKAGKLQTGPFSKYSSKASAVRQLTAAIDVAQHAPPENFASDHLAEINKAIREGKTPSDANIVRYQLEKSDGIRPQQLQPDDLQPPAGEKGPQGNGDPGEEIFRQGGQEEKTFLTSPEHIDRVLRDKFGEKLIDGLREQGVLKFAKNSDEQPEGIRRGIKAIMRSPKDAQPAATLYYDRLTEHDAPGVLMHELGEHFGIVRMLGPERYNMMLNDLRKLKNDPEVRPMWDKVAANYLDPRAKSAGGVSSVDDPRFMREVAAHLVENHPDLPFVRRLINEIRAFFFEKFGTTMGNRVDANLVRGLAASALRKASTGELPKMREYAPLVTSKPFVAPRR